MIAELGLFSLILALIASIMLAVIPLVGVQLNRSDWMSAAKIYVIGQFFFIALSYLFLTACFLQDDFSVVYVVSNSSVSLPWFYKICAVWGGHEGSMLLWVSILSFWTLLVTFLSSGLDKKMRTRVLVVLGWLSIGFILFLLTLRSSYI